MFDRHSKLAFIVVCAILLLTATAFQGAVAYLGLYLRKLPVQPREMLTSIPRVLGSWRAVGEDVALPVEMIESLGTDIYLNREYMRELPDGTKQSVGVHIAYYTGMIDAVPHVPDRCLVAAGLDIIDLPVNVDLPVDDSAWSDDPGPVNRRTGLRYRVLEFPHYVTGQSIRVHMPLGEMQLRMSEYRQTKARGANVYAGYYFIANGQTTPGPDKIRLLAFDMKDKYAYYCKVQFTMLKGVNFDSDTFVTIVGELSSVLLPELMRCLPDWAQIDQETDSGRTTQSDTQVSRNL